MRQLLTAPSFSDPDKSYSAGIQHWLLLLLAAVSVTFIPILAVLRPSETGLLLLQAAANLAITSVLMFLVRRGHVRLSGWLLITLILGLTLSSVLAEGGVRSGGYAALAVVVLASGLVLGAWPGALVTVICIAAGYVFVRAEQAGLVQSAHLPGAFEFWADLLVIFGVMLGIQSLAAYLNYQARLRAQSELAERTRVENALRASESHFRTLVDHLPDMTARYDSELRYLYASAHITDLTGHVPEAVVGLRDRDLGRPAHVLEAMEGALKQVWETGRPVEFDYGFMVNDAPSYFEALIMPELDEHTGRVDSVLLYNRNVTSRRAVEDALLKLESRYRQLLENIPVVTYINGLSDDAPTTYVSPQVESWLGYPREAFLANPVFWSTIVHPDDAASVAAENRRSIQTGQRFMADYRLFTSSGQVVWVRDEAVIVRDENGQPEHWLGVWTDITERKLAEAAVRESERLYRQAIEAAGAVPYRQDYASERYSWMGDGIAALTGYAANDITPAVWESLVQEAIMLGSRTDLPVQRALQSARSGELSVWQADNRIIARDGQQRWIADAAVEILDAEGKSTGSIGILQDVTIRKEAEQQLAAQAAEMEGLYRASAQLLHAPLTLPDLCRRVTAIAVEELHFPECSLWLLDRAAGRLTRMSHSGPPNKILEPPPNLTPDGPGLIAEVIRTSQAIYSPNVVTDPLYLNSDPQTWSELAVPLPGLEGPLGALNTESPLPDAYDERQQRVMAAFAERAALAIENALLVARLEQAVQRANELAVSAEEASRLKSQFLQNTSHELRTPLTNIIGSLDIVYNDLAGSREEERHFLNMALEAAEGLTSIVDDLLEIAKIESGTVELQSQVTAVGPLLEEAFALHRPQADAKGLSLCIEGSAAVSLIVADPDKLRRILQNLIGNAVKFTHNGGVTVRATSVPEAGRLVIEVIDTGIGVSAEALSRLFQPFVQVDGSTTRRYGGAGLGLTIARRLAEMMQGALTMESAGEGQGTRLILTLPLAAVPA